MFVSVDVEYNKLQCRCIYPPQVTLVPRSGLLGQLVAFDFGGFTMVRGLAVHVLTEQEVRILDTTTVSSRRAKRKPYVCWL